MKYTLLKGFALYIYIVVENYVHIKKLDINRLGINKIFSPCTSQKSLFEIGSLKI